MTGEIRYMTSNRTREARDGRMNQSTHAPSMQTADLIIHEITTLFTTRISICLSAVYSHSHSCARILSIMVITSSADNIVDKNSNRNNNCYLTNVMTYCINQTVSINVFHLIRFRCLERVV